ncbi:hypothetical protein GCM10027280_57160 [Micromonospora polyrhachis]|uniref:Uncharacterized protein YukE n=1 Tax=Micromonospora polyrhachis TaxID=1282883 RepID=A0A7W7SSR2_9ACTN|nr:WXG100 family type VII secretion target [Micromonospora polyrhachis]MBB4960239.1 uncharacterized protein YukE [Micromonospora polyrhachis]
MAEYIPYGGPPIDQVWRAVALLSDERLYEAAQTYRAFAGRMLNLQITLSLYDEELAKTWQGEAADAFMTQGAKIRKVANSALTAALDNAQALDTIADKISQVQSAMQTLWDEYRMQLARYSGGGYVDLTANGSPTLVRTPLEWQWFDDQFSIRAMRIVEPLLGLVADPNMRPAPPPEFEGPKSINVSGLFGLLDEMVKQAQERMAPPSAPAGVAGTGMPPPPAPAAPTLAGLGAAPPMPPVLQALGGLGVPPPSPPVLPAGQVASRGPVPTPPGSIGRPGGSRPGGPVPQPLPQGLIPPTSPRTPVVPVSRTPAVPAPPSRPSVALPGSRPADVSGQGGSSMSSTPTPPLRPSASLSKDPAQLGPPSQPGEPGQPRQPMRPPSLPMPPRRPGGANPAQAASAADALSKRPPPSLGGRGWPPPGSGTSRGPDGRSTPPTDAQPASLTEELGRLGPRPVAPELTGQRTPTPPMLPRGPAARIAPPAGGTRSQPAAGTAGVSVGRAARNTPGTPPDDPWSPATPFRLDLTGRSRRPLPGEEPQRSAPMLAGARSPAESTNRAGNPAVGRGELRTGSPVVTPSDRLASSSKPAEPDEQQPWQVPGAGGRVLDTPASVNLPRHSAMLSGLPSRSE